MENGSDGVGVNPTTLLQWLYMTYDTDDPTTIDPFGACYSIPDEKGARTRSGPYHCAPDVSRTRTINLPAVFEGSAQSFQEHVQGGGSITIDMKTLLRGVGSPLWKSKAWPNRDRLRDKLQKVNPATYDMDCILVNQLILGSPESTAQFGVGVSSNALPSAYREMREEQVKELKAEMGIKYEGPSMIAHIPANSKDQRQIPLINHVANGYHAESITKTFGGISTKQLWTGIHFFSPNEAVGLGLERPPKEHDAALAPEGVKQVYNSWCLVPRNHILSHISMLPSSVIKNFGYAVHQIQMPNGAPVPFLLMDLWTVHNYARCTVKDALLKMDRRPLADISVTLHPLKGGTWLEGCKPGEHTIPGKITFNLMIQYTMFPRGCADNKAVCCTLAKGFPRHVMGMRDAASGNHGAPPILTDQEAQDILAQVPSTSKKGKEEEEDMDMGLPMFDPMPPMQQGPAPQGGGGGGPFDGGQAMDMDDDDDSPPGFNGLAGM